MNHADSDTAALFETPRMRCRRWVPDDLDAIHAVYADPESMRWVDDGLPLSRERCAEWFDITRANYARRGYGMFALDDRKTGETVGFCGLVHPGGQPEPEVKYAIRRSRWGEGLATEAVVALLEFGARELGLDTVIATIAPENLASQRVVSKAGARLVDVLHHDDGSSTQVYEWTSPCEQSA